MIALDEAKRRILELLKKAKSKTNKMLSHKENEELNKLLFDRTSSKKTIAKKKKRGKILS